MHGWKYLRKEMQVLLSDKFVCYDQNFFWFRNATTGYELQMTHHYCILPQHRFQHIPKATLLLPECVDHVDTLIILFVRRSVLQPNSTMPCLQLRRSHVGEWGFPGATAFSVTISRPGKALSGGVFKKRTRKLKRLHMQLYIGVAVRLHRRYLIVGRKRDWIIGVLEISCVLLTQNIFTSEYYNNF